VTEAASGSGQTPKYPLHPPEADVVLVTGDLSMRLRAEARGLKVAWLGDQPKHLVPTPHRESSILAACLSLESLDYSLIASQDVGGRWPSWPQRRESRRPVQSRCPVPEVVNLEEVTRAGAGPKPTRSDRARS
jgi:hypothetical protein